MLDLLIRNARLPNARDGRLVDIGIAQGCIAAVEPHIAAEAPSHDAEGRLCCAGLVETHIHLDKSRIIDRCTPEPSRAQPDHMRRVQAVKPSFTVEDIYNRAKATLEDCIKHGARFQCGLAQTRRGAPLRARGAESARTPDRAGQRRIYASFGPAVQWQATSWPKPTARLSIERRTGFSR